MPGRVAAIVASILATFAFGGCVDDAAPAASKPAGSGAAPRTGIEGVVSDLERVPLPQAQVRLVEPDLLAATDGAGRFAFDVPAGAYTLNVARVGYESLTTLVKVDPGQRRVVNLLLDAIVHREPRNVTTWFDGRITCAVGTWAFISEECGNGVNGPSGPIGRNPDNKIDWVYNITNITDFRGAVFELTWTPGSEAAKTLAFTVSHNLRCPPEGCHADKVYCDILENYGGPPLRCEIPVEDLGIARSSDLPWEMTARAQAAPTEALAVPALVLQQEFRIWKTEFYGAPIPENFTVLKKSS